MTMASADASDSPRRVVSAQANAQRFCRPMRCSSMTVHQFSRGIGTFSASFEVITQLMCDMSNFIL